MTAGIALARGEPIRNGAPFKCWGESADMTGATIRLASIAGAYVSGTVIPVDGGIVASSRALKAFLPANFQELNPVGQVCAHFA